MPKKNAVKIGNVKLKKKEDEKLHPPSAEVLALRKGTKRIYLHCRE